MSAAGPGKAHLPLHRATAAAAALALIVAGSVTVVASTVSSAAPAAAATVDPLPPGSGILPGPSPSGSSTDDGWGPCVPHPGAANNCAGWLVPPGQISESFPGTDDAPNVVVGRNFTAGLNSAETEGLLVVNGNADFLRSYNVGVAGGGTGVVPAADADMLVVGGDATVVNPSQDPNQAPNAANVQVGLTTGDGASRFGNIHVGGAHNFRDPSYSAASNPDYGVLGNVDTANQDPLPAIQNFLDSDTSVLTTDHYDDLFGATGTMATYSQQCYAELSTDTAATQVVNQDTTLALEHGTVTQGTEAGVSDYTLTSTGTGDLVEFSLPATMGTPGSPVDINIVGVKDGATVLINTLGTGTVAQYVQNVYWGTGTGQGLNTRALQLGNTILWNYPYASDISLGGAGQFPGSILVGESGSTTNIGFSGANGRVYTPGDLVHSGTAATTSGDELHAYPFSGALGCIQAVPGTFSVKKALIGDGAGSVPDDTTFTVHWTVTDGPDAGNRSGDVTVKADGTVVNGPTDLAEGDVVTFSEPTLPTVPGVDWGTPTISPNPVTIGADDTVAAVTVTNTATLERGGFTITKAVTGDPGASTTSFKVDWSCTAENLDGDDSGTATISAGDSATITGFPVGTTCTITEDTPSDDNGTWATPTIDPKTVTIAQGDGTAQVVTVTNTFTHAVGGFTITKKVTGDSGAATTTFTGTWTCDAENADGDSSGTWSLEGGGSDTHEGFPTGTTCSVAEDAPTDANGTWDSSIDPDGDFVITEGDATATVVTVTNTFSHAVGGFTVTKAVTGDPGASTTSFDIDWSCSAENAAGNDSGTVTVGAGESASVAGFPTGTTCTFSEDTPTDDNGTWADPVVDPDSITISEGDGSAQVVTVTNDFTHAVGGFTIDKRVTGDDGASTSTFTGTWTCDAPDAAGDSSGTWSLKNGGSDTHEGFPTGTTCSVTETTPTDDNGTWKSSIDPSGDFKITEGDASAKVVTVKNTFTHAVGGFTIDKRVTGDDGASTSTFKGTWTCDAPDAAGDSSGTWSLKNGGSDTHEGFPTGTTCSVAENPTKDDNGTWTSSIDPAGDFTISEGTASATVVSVTNDFASAIGGFDIKKTVEGDSGSDIDSFTVDWSCDRPNADGNSSGTVTLKADETSDEISGFPVGTTCTISEPTVDDPNGTWSASIAGGGKITIGSDDPADVDVVAVTNTFDANTPTPTPTPTPTETTPAPSPTTSGPTTPATGPTAPAPTTSGPTTPAATTPSSSSGLATTGASVLPYLFAAILLLAAGTIIVAAARRRRED